MKTAEILESLLFQNPNLRAPLYSLNFISEYNNIKAKERLEYKNLISKFKDPIIICIFSFVQYCIFIEREPVTKRKRSCIIINGEFSSFEDLSKTQISKKLMEFINIKDFIPTPFTKKIVYITDYELNGLEDDFLFETKEQVLEGIVFSEHLKGHWTIASPLELDPKIVKTGPSFILYEILQDIFDQNER